MTEIPHGVIGVVRNAVGLNGQVPDLKAVAVGKNIPFQVPMLGAGSKMEDTKNSRCVYNSYLETSTQKSTCKLENNNQSYDKKCEFVSLNLFIL